MDGGAEDRLPADYWKEWMSEDGAVYKKKHQVVREQQQLLA